PHRYRGRRRGLVHAREWRIGLDRGPSHRLPGTRVARRPAPRRGRARAQGQPRLPRARDLYPGRRADRPRQRRLQHPPEARAGMSYKVPLPVMAPEPRALVPCTECGKCCTYVAVGINAPTTPRLATDILWYLYHDRVYVYRDGAGEWSVHFETRCRQLG